MGRSEGEGVRTGRGLLLLLFGAFSHSFFWEVNGFWDLAFGRKARMPNPPTTTISKLNGNPSSLLISRGKHPPLFPPFHLLSLSLSLPFIVVRSTATEPKPPTHRTCIIEIWLQRKVKFFLYQGYSYSHGSGVKIKVGLEEEEEEEEKKVKKKAKRKRMEKGIDSTVATKTGETATPLCKKSDGKGWHCKRPAHLPHSLCQYHLTQLRSYTNNNSHRKVADQATGGGDKHRKKMRRVDTAGDGNDFYYYYYSGFGPWRGKRRGSSYGSHNFGNVTEGVGRENTESVDGHDAPVTGDDEEDNEEEEEEENGKGCCNYEDASDDEEEKWNCRKRGRKPVKARSLKSLL